MLILQSCQALWLTKLLNLQRSCLQPVCKAAATTRSEQTKSGNSHEASQKFDDAVLTMLVLFVPSWRPASTSASLWFLLAVPAAGLSAAILPTASVAVACDRQAFRQLQQRHHSCERASQSGTGAIKKGTFEVGMHFLSLPAARRGSTEVLQHCGWGLTEDGEGGASGHQGRGGGDLAQ